MQYYRWGYSHGYCGAVYLNKDIIAQPFLVQAVVIFFFTDLYEYAYHWIGHRYSILWNIHKHHHKFFNPSPFAVIADEYVDQFVRTLPMIILPLMMPINMDLLFAIFATLFYGYGVYLHWGYESTVLTAHNPVFNTAYHHYTHHAISSMNRYVICAKSIYVKRPSFSSFLCVDLSTRDFSSSYGTMFSALTIRATAVATNVGRGEAKKTGSS